MKWKISVVIACVFGTFLCFLPILSMFSYLTPINDFESELYRAVRSTDFKYSNIASIAVAIHMIFEILLDLFNYNEISKIGIGARFLLVFSTLIPNILFIAIPFEKILPLFQCIVSARSLMHTGIALIYLESNGYWFWTNKHTFVTFLFYSVAGFLRNIAYFSPYSGSLLTLSIMICFVAVFGIFIICMFWICKFRFLYDFEWNFESTFSFIVILLCCSMFLAITILRYYPFIDWNAMNTATLTTISYLELLFIALITAAHNRYVDNQIMATKKILETKRTFVRFVSHEIRTPLNTVSLGIDLLQSEIRKAGNFPELIEITNDLKCSGEIALSLVNDLLVYDKLDAGILKLELDHLPMWNFLVESIRPFQLQARQAEIELVLPSPPLSIDSSCLLPFELEDIIAIVDKSRIRQVVSNMISNALKFSPKHNSVIIDITFKPWTDEAISAPLLLPLEDSINKEYKGFQLMKMILSVTDQGPGLSLENQNKLFKEIIQFNPGKLQAGGGSGLGLWISQRIATMHGGKLSVMSEGEGFGSTFTFTLPVYIKSIPENPSQIDPGSDRDKGGRVINYHTTSKQGPPQKQRRSSEPTVIEWKSDSWHDKRVNINTTTTTTTVAMGASSDYYKKESGTINTTTWNIDKEGGNIQDDVIKNLFFLVVDDVPMNRKMICRVLQGKCRGTLEAEDGVVAVQLIKQRLLEVEAEKGEGQQGRDGTGTRPIDVILMDYMMPNMNGHEATRLIRSLGYTGIIIGVTGNAQPAEVKEFLNAGANKILIKPVNVQKIMSTICEIQLHSV